MKKTIFLVSALVVMAMCAMFVACEKSNSIENGCTCTFSYQGETETYEYSPEEMREIALSSAEEGYIINTCSDLQKMHLDVLNYSGRNVSVKCR